jgi:hypothetical protein
MNGTRSLLNGDDLRLSRSVWEATLLVIFSNP